MQPNLLEHGRDGNQNRDSNDDEFKIHISRVPTAFTEEVVKRILEDKLRREIHDDDSEIVTKVELIYPRDNDEPDDRDQTTEEAAGTAASSSGNAKEKVSSKSDDVKVKEHRGFGFVSFSSQQALDVALELQTIKGGRKTTSKKLHTMHLRPYKSLNDWGADGDEGGREICYLWSLNRCPYGDECKFQHVGPGGCNTKPQDELSQKERQRKRNGKCFAYKKGKCTKGDDCPFSHDFEPNKTGHDDNNNNNTATAIKSKSDKDCINWKTKGKCRKGDKCEYRHDPALQKRALEKKQNQKRKRQDGDDKNIGKVVKKEKQPLAIRVFGLPYDCSEDDAREFFKECGIINKILFPTFDDSGRSKGYCGIWFASPKAVAKALELDGIQFHGRWLRIQSGKSMELKEWESLHSKKQQQE